LGTLLDTLILLPKPCSFLLKIWTCHFMGHKLSLVCSQPRFFSMSSFSSCSWYRLINWMVCTSKIDYWLWFITYDCWSLGLLAIAKDTEQLASNPQDTWEVLQHVHPKNHQMSNWWSTGSGQPKIICKDPKFIYY
jgi:hypothetical protein